MFRKGVNAEEQSANVKLVSEVKKYPCLYNYKLDDYSKRNVVDAAWKKVAQAMQDTAPNCKEKWRNLRTVFVRKLKLTPSGSTRRNPYYLNESMRFIVPFIKAQNLEDLPNAPASPAEDERQEEEVDENGPDSEASMDAPQPEDALADSKEPHATESSDHCKNKRRRRRYDSSEPDYSLMDSCQDARGMCQRPPNSRQLFFLSLMPEVDGMTHSQFKVFRRSVLDSIDYAMTCPEHSPNYTPHSSVSAGQNYVPFQPSIKMECFEENGLNEDSE